MSENPYGDEQYFPGIYRGIVRSTPDGQNRLQLEVPQIHGASVLQAMPCHDGEAHPPAIGKGVWVMFEAGDPAMPVWMGIWGPNTYLTSFTEI